MTTPLAQSSLDPRGAQLASELAHHHIMIDHVQWFDHITSTNDEAKRFEQDGSALIISNRQTAGRGQAGRSWQSPTGNLYLSLLTSLQHPVSGRLALEVALALCNMPLLALVHNLEIKWPNDLYFEDAKWGGILIEPLQPNQVIIGVGINIKPMQDQVLDQAVTDLQHMTKKHIDQLTLALQTTQAILRACEEFDHGSMELSTRYAAYDTLLEQPVVIHHAGLPDLYGKALGIRPDGALIIEANDQQKIIYSGQVRKVIP